MINSYRKRQGGVIFIAGLLLTGIIALVYGASSLILLMFQIKN
jgi:hypothetical protein